MINKSIENNSNDLKNQDINQSKNTHPVLKFYLALFCLGIAISGIAYLNFKKPFKGVSNKPNNNSPLTLTTVQKDLEFVPFQSKEDFKDYLSEGQQNTGNAVSMFSESGNRAVTQDLALGNAPMAKIAMGGGGAERVSTTNVQILGIDEPDIIKTNGSQIFFSSDRPQPVYFMDDSVQINQTEGQESIQAMPPVRKIRPPVQQYGATDIIQAMPVNQLKNLGQLKESGDLLLDKDVLMVFPREYDRRGVVAYDVSNPQTPTSTWEYRLNESYQINTSRLYNGNLYLVLQNYINYDQPCLLKPFKEENSIEVTCSQIYHPRSLVNVDQTYMVLKMNPQTGKVLSSVSFVANSGNSIISMSKENLFITTSNQVEPWEFLVNFFESSAKDLFPEEIHQQIAKLASYDISSQSKLMELQTIFTKLQRKLDKNEQKRIEAEMTNRMVDFIKVHGRELEQTSINKIELESLNITAQGTVPGHPLNQFAIDEDNGNVRIATNSNPNIWQLGLGETGESVNDLYVLDKKLRVVGELTGLGKGERIYSVRFLGEKAYVVTFKQTDPFYVVDLKNPANPVVAGELKIPGYSSYLHPLTNNLILGVGKENNKVKLSVFDVSNPNNPLEIDKYMLADYWSEALDNHKAFLQDDKYEIFFMPAQTGGYVFNYTGGKLKLTKAIADEQVKRAVFLNDNLYVFSNNKISVFNENTWDEVGKLDL